jgi:hypothetical protein
MTEMGNEKLVEYLFGLKAKKEEEDLIKKNYKERAEEKSTISKRTKMHFDYTKDPILPSEKFATFYVDKGKDFKNHKNAFRSVPR